MANLARETAIVKVIEGVGRLFFYFFAFFFFQVAAEYLIALFDALLGLIVCSKCCVNKVTLQSGERLLE